MTCRAMADWLARLGHETPGPEAPSTHDGLSARSGRQSQRLPTRSGEPFQIGCRGFSRSPTFNEAWTPPCPCH